MNKNWVWNIKEEDFIECKKCVMLNNDNVDLIGKVIINNASVDFTVRYYFEYSFLDFDVYITNHEEVLGTIEETSFAYLDGGRVFDKNNIPISFEEFKEMATKVILEYSSNCSELEKEILECNNSTDK